MLLVVTGRCSPSLTGSIVLETAPTFRALAPRLPYGGNSCHVNNLVHLRLYTIKNLRKSQVSLGHCVKLKTVPTMDSSPVWQRMFHGHERCLRPGHQYATMPSVRMAYKFALMLFLLFNSDVTSMISTNLPCRAKSTLPHLASAHYGRARAQRSCRCRSLACGWSNTIT